MQIDGNILLKLRDMQDSLTPVERILADYVLANTQSVLRCSVRDLATKSKTSDASVLRFCRTLGCRGYRDFIVNVSAALSAHDSVQDGPYTDIQPGDDLQTIIRNVSLSNRRSIEDTLSILRQEEVARAVELLRKADKVDFYGMGASGLVCMDAQQKFMRINKMSHAYTDGHSQLTAATLLQKGDVVVLISNSGTTAEILDALEIAKECQASVIAITRYSKSELAKNADVVLYISTPEITIRSGAMGSRIAMLNIIDILFVGVSSAEYKNVQDYLRRTHDILQTKHR